LVVACLGERDGRLRFVVVTLHGSADTANEETEESWDAWPVDSLLINFFLFPKDHLIFQRDTLFVSIKITPNKCYLLPRILPYFEAHFFPTNPTLFKFVFKIYSIFPSSIIRGKIYSSGAFSSQSTTTSISTHTLTRKIEQTEIRGAKKQSAHDSPQKLSFLHIFRISTSTISVIGILPGIHIVSNSYITNKLCQRGQKYNGFRLTLSTNVINKSAS
jgi:hypothetical protein